MFFFIMLAQLEIFRFFVLIIIISNRKDANVLVFREFNKSRFELKITSICVKDLELFIFTLGDNLVRINYPKNPNLHYAK